MTPMADTQIAPQGMAPRQALLLWAAVTLGVMVLLHLYVFGLQGAAFAAFAVFTVGTAVLWWRIPTDYPHMRLGACNAVTLLRAGLGASLLTPLITDLPVQGSLEHWGVILVAIAALSLDGVDGFLARRSGLSSAYGARFDMEVDAALSLILMLHVLVAGIAGPYVIVLGVMRYVFIAASYRLPWLDAPLPPSFARKLVCVGQVAALIALQLPVLPSEAAHSIALLASLALMWSFGRDIFWLWRHRF